MLVLSKKKNESVRVVLPDGRIGNVSVVKISSNRVSLGFDFPRDVPIVRLEALDKTPRKQE